MSDTIALIGLACRYPDADDLPSLWNLVCQQRRAFRMIPPERLDLADYFDRDRSAPDCTYSTRAALLEGWEFDRSAFHIPGPVFRAADPAHWLALETASRALTDAGFPNGDGLDRDRVAVIVGNSLTGEVTRAATMRLRWPYVRRVLAAALAAEGMPVERQRPVLAQAAEHYLRSFAPVTDETLAGGLSNTIAGRICNYFDFHGGGYTVDGACASSLLAVIDGCTALATGRVDAVLAGGVDISLDPFELIGFAKIGALAADRMLVYDEQSAGFWPGEGCGMVALMRAADARRAGVRCYAEIVGWGVSSDGKGGLTRPERAGQLLAQRRAYQQAGLDPASVLLVEGHGTGTAVGDATELAALAELRRGALVPAALGSIKANFGHTKAAAGVAGLLKATLSVAAEVLPPTTGCEHPLPLLRDPDVPLRVLGQAQPWPPGLPRTAAVSAMGFGGINTHLVLAEADRPTARPVRTAPRQPYRPPPQADLIVLSAPDSAALRRQLDRLAEIGPRLSEAEVGDLACQSGRAVHNGQLRAALVAGSPEQLGERAPAAARRLAELVSGRLLVGPGLFLGDAVPGRVTVLFPGQGAPSYPDAGALGRHTPSLVAWFAARAGADSPAGTAVDTAVVQPAIFAASLAAYHWLTRLGITPMAAVGHSLGEITGLVWAGCVSEQDGRQVVTERGRLMSQQGTTGTGMLSVAADAGTATRLGEGTRLVVAAYNGPAAHVLAGALPDVHLVARRAAAAGIPVTVLPVSHAFHSSAVAGCGAAFKDYLDTISFGPPLRRLVSTVTGRTVNGHDAPVDMLAAQLTNPVRFWDALREVLPDTDLFVEAGPGRVLTGLVAAAGDPPAVSLDAGNPDDQALAEVAGALFAAGAVDDLTRWYDRRAARPIDIWRDRVFLANPCSTAPRTEAGHLGSGHLDSGRPPSPAPTDPVVTSAGDITGIVVELVVAATELDPAAISLDQRLLSDLHLTSLRVTQLVTAAAAAAGRDRPIAPLAAADASLAELVAALEGLPAARPADEGGVLGVAVWIGVFADEPVPADIEVSPVSGSSVPPVSGSSVPPVSGNSVPPVPGNSVPPVSGPWRSHIAPGHPLSPAAQQIFGTAAGMATPLAYLPDLIHPAAVPTLLAAARAGVDAGRLVVVTHGCGLSGFLRSLQAEYPDLGITLVRVPMTEAGLRQALQYAVPAPGRWQELLIGTGDRPLVPASAPLILAPLTLAPASPGPGAAAPLAPSDVVLVSGGAKGIGVECALAIAVDSGAALALVGRSSPDDDAVAGNLRRLQEAGVRVAYHPADVTDPTQARAAVEALAAELGPITALLHASGLNEPRRFADLTEQDLRTHLGPKPVGLGNLLAVLDPQQLRLLVTFGSVIGRYGLAGECHYALANGVLREQAEQLAGQLPSCRVLHIDWSVWTGAGMGERLGVLEALLRADVTPIPVVDGIALFRHLLATHGLPTSVAVHGRVGGRHEPAAATPVGRFCEDVRVHVPAVELVTDSRLDLTRDPYLADHRIDGVAVLPGVVGLEAMAQVAAALVGRPLTELADIALNQPVIVPDDDVRVLRVCALRRGDAIEVVIRTDETGFRIDHFSARFPLAASPGREPLALVPTGPELAAADLYRTVCFHSGRFQRVRQLTGLRARTSRASIGADAMPWCPELPLLLGSPAMNDATIHVLQASVPHRRLLPVGCARLVVHPGPVAGSVADLEVFGVERQSSDHEYVWDVEARDESGRSVLQWHRLVLRDVGPLPVRGPWPAALLAVYLERSAAGLGLDPSLQVEISKVHPPVEGWSRSHLGDLVLAVHNGRLACCDWEPVADRSEEDWRGLLGATLFPLLQQIQVRTQEPLSTVGTRVWTAVECLSKAGHPPVAPLVLAGTYRGGWVVLRDGSHQIASLVTTMDGLPGPVAIALLTGDPHAYPRTEL